MRSKCGGAHALRSARRARPKHQNRQQKQRSQRAKHRRGRLALARDAGREADTERALELRTLGTGVEVARQSVRDTVPACDVDELEHARVHHGRRCVDRPEARQRVQRVCRLIVTEAERDARDHTDAAHRRRPVVFVAMPLDRGCAPQFSCLAHDQLPPLVPPPSARRKLS